MGTMMRTVVLGVAAGLLTIPAAAQTTRYPVHSIDFGIWCTEVQHLSWDRCDKRLPEDVQKFEHYRAVVERYEIPYLQEKEDALHFDETILHNDPVDKKPDSKVLQPPPANAGP